MCLLFINRLAIVDILETLDFINETERDLIAQQEADEAALLAKKNNNSAAGMKSSRGGQTTISMPKLGFIVI